jgi:hypothetical protein
LEDRTSGRVILPFQTIVKANLEVDVETEFHRVREQEDVDRDLIRNRSRQG